MLAILKAKAYRAIVPLDFALFVKQRPDCEHSGNPSKCEIAELVRNLRLWSSYRARVDLLKCVHFYGEEYGILGMVFGKPPSFRETRGLVQMCSARLVNRRTQQLVAVLASSYRPWHSAGYD